MEAAVEEDGAFEPLVVGLDEVECHCRMHNLVDRLLVCFAGQKELGEHTLLQDAAAIDLWSYQLAQLLSQRCRCAHEALCSSIAVVDLDAVFLQQLADIALPAADASGDSDELTRHCSMR